MPSFIKPSRDFSRRSFIKGSAVAAAAAAAGALAGCSSAADEPSSGSGTPQESPDQIFSGVCRGNCQGGCFLNVHVRDGRVVRTTARDMPDARYNRICAKGLTHCMRIYSPQRLRYPMKRIGERGSGEFERISWDEAIGTIVEKWNAYTAEYGPTAFGVYWGSGNYGLISSAEVTGSPVQRLLSATGCSLVNPMVDLSGMGAYFQIIGAGAYGSANEATDLVNSSTIFVWMANPVISQPHNVHFILEAQEAGAKLVVIDPQFGFLASKADVYVPVNPASDAALAIGMIKVMLERGWVNYDFLRASTSAAYLVKGSDGMFLRTTDLDAQADPATAVPLVVDADGELKPLGEAADPQIEASYALEDGSVAVTSYSMLLKRLDEYTLDYCVQKSGIDLETIEGLADLYANGGPASIYKMYGANHYTNGTSAMLAVNTLVMMAGQIGGPGKGFSMAYTSGAVYNAAMSLAGDPEAPGAPFGNSPIAGIDVLSMDVVLETKQFQGKDVNLKGLYVTHVNPLNAAADRNYMLDWMSKIEFIAMTDMNMNESMRYADIILPAAHWFELEDTFNSYATHPYVLHQEKAVEPLFEARTDFEIVKAIAEGIGAGKYYDYTAEEYLTEALASDYAASLGISLETLRENGAMRVLPDVDHVFADGGAFPAPLNLYQERLLSVGNNGQAYDPGLYRMLHHVDPTEANVDNPLREKFPFQMLSDHSRLRTHSQWWDVQLLVEVDKEPHLKMNPKDAEGLGVAEGDEVRVYNDRGYVVLPVTLHAGLPQGMLACEKGWAEEQFRDGHFSSLSGHFRDGLVANSAFNDVLVAVEKTGR